MSKPNPTIRTAARPDLPAVVALWQEHQEYHAACDPYFERSPDANPGFQKYLDEHLEELGLFVAEIDGRIVGFILGEPARRPPCFASRAYGMIDDLAVTAEWRGQGLGQALLERMVAWFQAQGIQRIETRVLISNPLASNFWQAAGFEAYLSCVYKEVCKLSSFYSLLLLRLIFSRSNAV